MNAVLPFFEAPSAFLRPDAFTIAEEAPDDVPAREALLDRTMGPGRKRKSSEKLRQGRFVSAGLAFAARSVDGRLVGTVRLWDIAAGTGRDGRPVAALLLGPLAVDASSERRGIGSALVRHAIAEAERLKHGAILLVGDPEYYQRFGFSAGLTEALAMPGPVERRRFLALELEPGALEGATGLLVARGRRVPHRAPAFHRQAS